MIRLTLAALLTFSIVALGTAHAEPKNGLGIGIIIGEPTGLSLKKWISNDRAIDGGIAWSFSENDSMHLHGDYLIHRFDLFASPDVKGQLALYYGLGARIKLKEGNDGTEKKKNDDDVLVGVRVPLGITYLFTGTPIDLFAEIVPVLNVITDTDFDLNASVGVRYYF
jgi:hypothetical protein